LQTIHRRATGLSNFVEAYSNLYQLPEPKFEVVELDQLIGRIRDLFKDQFIEENIVCTTEIQKPDISVKIDEHLIEQVLINLVKNGLEATKERDNRSLHISVNSLESSMTIAVKDNGVGIPADQQESIFMPFYSTKEGGNGIGLSFAQHVMRLHNGFLSVSSVPGEGSIFALVFG